MRRGLKGSVVQHWPTMNPERMMMGHGILNLAAGAPVQDALVFNNSDDGSMLAIWDMTITTRRDGTFTPNTFFAGFGTGKRTLPGSFGQQLPCLPTAGVGFGKMFTDNNSAGDLLLPYSALADPGLWQWPHDWVIAYVPQGYVFEVEVGAIGVAGSLGVQIGLIWEWGVPLV